MAKRKVNDMKNEYRGFKPGELVNFNMPLGSLSQNEALHAVARRMKGDNEELWAAVNSPDLAAIMSEAVSGLIESLMTPEMKKAFSQINDADIAKFVNENLPTYPGKEG